MSKQTLQANVLDNPRGITSGYKLIENQLNITSLENKNFLQTVSSGIFLLTIKKEIQTKKMIDYCQYYLLPGIDKHKKFIKLSRELLKNYCFNTKEHKGLPDGIFNYQSTYLPVFYYDIEYVEKYLLTSLTNEKYFVREALNNRTLIVSDNHFNYPLSLGRIVSTALWQGQDIKTTIKQEVNYLNKIFVLIKSFYDTLIKTYKDISFHVDNGYIYYSYNNVTQKLDHASIIHDVNNMTDISIKNFLTTFDLDVINTYKSFPSVVVRSPVHIKARPESVFDNKCGYSVVATSEYYGKQTTVSASNDKKSKAFDYWFLRSLNHVFRQSYEARVVMLDETAETFSLVGEQVTTIALFPDLIKGVYEQLKLKAPNKVKLVAHNEDVLTIATDNCSWIKINNANVKAQNLFKMISSDGADPLSLFEQASLPKLGTGNFTIHKVPEHFFELLNTASSIENTSPHGYSHYLLGLAYRCINETGLAIHELKKAVKFNRNDADILNALGSTLMDTKNIEEAVYFLQLAFNNQPDNAELANKVGCSEMKYGRLDEAIKYFEKAVRLSPATAGYLKDLGESYLKSSRHLEALDILNQAIKCDPNSAHIHASLAYAHLAKGDQKTARRHALIAYKEIPDNMEIVELLLKTKKPK